MSGTRQKFESNYHLSNFHEARYDVIHCAVMYQKCSRLFMPSKRTGRGRLLSYLQKKSWHPSNPRYTYKINFKHLTFVAKVNVLTAFSGVQCVIILINALFLITHISHTHTRPFSLTYVVGDCVILCSKSRFLLMLRYQLNLLPGCQQNNWCG